jgi:hypothetical protein
MRWHEIREHYPHRWLLVEAIAARSEAGERKLEDLTVVDAFPDARTAMGGYLDRHRRSPERELYVLHTDRERLEIAEREWTGLRRAG